MTCKRVEVFDHLRGEFLPLDAARLGGVPLADAAGLSFWNSADRPVPILQAGEAAMRALMEKACGDGEVTAVVFPAFARALHGFSDYAARLPRIRLREEKIDGIGLAGPVKRVRSLTGALKLLR